ncbi:MAG: hypothetical protein ABJ056_08640 [Halioglobus sp.]
MNATREAEPSPASAEIAVVASSKVWWAALRHAAIALAISASLLVTIYSIWFFDFHPEFESFRHSSATTVVIPGKNFRPVVVAGGGVAGDAAVISGLADGEAIVALDQSFDAEDYPFIKLEIEGATRFTNAFIFWRLAKNPEEIYSLPLNRSGDGVTQVAMVYGGDDYKGNVQELAVGFFDGPALGFSNNNNVPIHLKSIELLPFSGTRVAEQIFEDWTNPPLWQGYSNNIVRGIHKNGMVFPNLVLNLLVATSALLLVAVRVGLSAKLRESLSVSRTVLVVIGLCWVMGDALRWTWRIEQLIDTHERYYGLPLEERIRNNPIRCARFPDDCRADLLPYF